MYASLLVCALAEIPSHTHHLRACERTAYSTRTVHTHTRGVRYQSPPLLTRANFCSLSADGRTRPKECGNINNVWQMRGLGVAATTEGFAAINMLYY